MRITLMILFFCVLDNYSNAQNLTTNERKFVDECVNQYTSALQLSSKKNSPNFASRFFGMSSRSDNHLVDLSLLLDISVESIDNNYDYWGFERYADVLVSSVQYEIPMTIEILNNEAFVNNEECAVYIRKTLGSSGKNRVIDEVVVVELPQDRNNSRGYKILRVETARVFKANTPLANLPVSNEEINCLAIKSRAREFYDKQEFDKAKPLFESLLQKDKLDFKYLKAKFDECNSILTIKELQTKSEMLFNSGDYGAAKVSFSQLMSKTKEPAELQRLKMRIKDCEVGELNTRFDKFVRDADANFQQQNYSSARVNYEHALRLKPADKYATQRLETAKSADNIYATQQIEQAVDLAWKSRRNWGRYMETLLKYEGYGTQIRLRTLQYYNIVMMMDEKNRRVRKTLKISKKDCFHYCRIYAKKLRDSLAYETDPTLKKKAEHLLNEIINRKNQN